MEWMQLLVLIATMGGMFFWLRSESSADRRELRSAMEAMKESTDAKIEAIHLEMKDFHGRLCAIEERNSRR